MSPKNLFGPVHSPEGEGGFQPRVHCLKGDNNSSAISQMMSPRLRRGGARTLSFLAVMPSPPDTLCGVF